MTAADADRPSTWKKYEEGLCVGCKALCCSMTVEITPEDLLQLELISASEVMASPKKLGKRLRTEGFISAFSTQARTFSLAKKPDGFCIYLVNSACSVYKRRPQVCRTFPEVGPRPGFCPASRVRITDGAAKLV